MQHTINFFNLLIQHFEFSPSGLCALSECLEKFRFGLGAGCQETWRTGFTAADGHRGKGAEGDCLGERRDRTPGNHPMQNAKFQDLRKNEGPNELLLKGLNISKIGS